MKLTKLTFRDCINMQNGLAQVKQPKISDIKDLDDKMDYLFHQDFAFAVARNKRELGNIIEDLQAILESSDEFKEYSDEREKTLRKLAIKDENKNPKTKTSNRGQLQYIVPDIDNNESLKQLDEKFKDVIKERDNQFAKYDKKLKDNSGFNPIMVPEKNIPKGLDMAAMDGVLFMTDFDEKSKK